ncbi:hypothetical protein KKP62_03125 [Rhodococcus sp. GOMB7]|jgi:hypothetical protein|uniref:hypothetical protein n=1 Tax=Rhodococcus TaxID=1827 RepID=UPI001412B6FE|nr:MULTISPECIES: hypothetical protein [Rhodococcus]MBT9293955.1 hypothetical protein [Rhodococcus sp. GOMB7]MCT6736521.1 hypothetical protein [Rhodococcus qingshengii]MDJ0435042.1 hypothetical protein [Rhodococcus qingshengii]QOS66559.1 hypothetical protein IM699_31185 [Rhodococcus qingshengii]ULD44802.1 hypothetical protein JKI97_30545 [Rhodococcus qingshengii]
MRWRRRRNRFQSPNRVELVDEFLDHVHKVAERTLPASDAPGSAGVRRLHVVATLIRELEEHVDTREARGSNALESASLGQFYVMTAHSCAARLAADFDAEDTPGRDDERLSALDEFHAVQAATGITVRVHGMPTSPEGVKALTELVRQAHRGEEPPVVAAENEREVGRFGALLDVPVPDRDIRGLVEHFERLADKSSGPIGRRMPVVRARALVAFFDQYAARLTKTGRDALPSPHVLEHATVCHLSERARWHLDRVRSIRR